MSDENRRSVDLGAAPQCEMLTPQTSSHMTRRRFLMATGTALSATTFGSRLLQTAGLDRSPFCRRNIGKLAANDPVILSYMKAVTIMQALPSTNPLSWTFQAEIHRNSCEHDTDYFWPWHRMYIYWFEKIIRKLSGDSSWALPYWDWCSPDQLALPCAFRDYTSALYTPNRRPTMNAGATLNTGHFSCEQFYAFRDFHNASDTLQRTHGEIHIEVGGWMADPCMAAFDPIFFVHHCNVDRLWNLWLAQGGTDPLSDTAWKKQPFHFVDENGTTVHMTQCDVVRAENQLNYVYEGEGTQVEPDCAKPAPEWHFKGKVYQARNPLLILSSDKTTILAEFRDVDHPWSTLANGGQMILLQFGNVTVDTQPNATWEVYVDLPTDADPDTENPHYVGNIVFFGAGIRNQNCGQFRPTHFVFLVNQALRASTSTGELKLTFVARRIQSDRKSTDASLLPQLQISALLLKIGIESTEL
jgi:hypothetical protein